MGGSEIAPFPRALRPLGRPADRVGESPLDLPRRGRPARIPRVPADALQDLLRLVTGLELWEPAVPDLGHALEHRLGHAADPDGNGALDGQRIDAGAVEAVVGAGERHHRLGPEL